MSDNLSRLACLCWTEGGRGDGIKIIVVIILVPLFLFGLGAFLGQAFRSAIFGL